MPCLHPYRLLVLLVLVLSTATAQELVLSTATAQESVWSMGRGDVQLGNQKFEQHAWAEAIVYFERAIKQQPANTLLYLKLGRCYDELNRYEEAVQTYGKALAMETITDGDALFRYAEALLALKKYDRALDAYQQLLAISQEEWIEKKIWRIHNRQYLWEDSAHVAIRRLSFNTEYSEFGPQRVGDRLIFSSNKKISTPVERLHNQTDFYRMYHTQITNDPNDDVINTTRAEIFARELQSAWNNGPCVLYDRGTRMAFVTNANERNASGARPLRLFFAARVKSQWNVDEAYPHFKEYSINSFTLNEAGDVLIFSADSPTGLGGKDLYLSEKKSGSWSVPVNLGPSINTPKDEVFPFLHANKTLYFSSDGHAGLGQLDLYKIAFTTDSLSILEPENLGYPINSLHDDFSIFMDSLGMHGFLASNRKAGGLDDDLYEFDVNLEQYPLTLNALLKIKDHSWSSTQDVKPWPNVTISMIDRATGTRIYQTTSDAQGNLILVIPKFSYYIIEVEGERGKQKVVFELSKYKRDLGIPEIVFVKDLFD
ncbi:MAG: tetratricopeptide repeat protein [Cyclobacteriaceae bacterium]|nr:tetratricopeptide repeat protein [Cyclobacteriaceae bacterium]